MSYPNSRTVAPNPGRAARAAPATRMTEAMVRLVGEQGYAVTTVADVIGLAQASRRTFYEYFSDRQDCLLSAAEQLAASWMELCDAAVEAAGQPGEPAVEAFVTAAFEAALSNPGALRLLLADLGGAGHPGVELHGRLLQGLGRSLGLALGFEQRPAAPPSSESMASETLVAQALAGAILQIPYTRSLRGSHSANPSRRRVLGLVPEVVRWACTYRSVQMPELVVGKVIPPTGGRAPGTLSLTAGGDRRRPLARTERGITRSFVVHNQRERILDAIANLSAAKGYAAVTIPELVTEAAVSVQALYEHFADKEDALLVAYQLGHRKALALTERAYDAQSTWGEGARAAVATLLSFLASEASFAHVALIDMPAAGARLATLAAQGAAAYSEFLKPGLVGNSNGRPAPDIAPEAGAHAIQTLCRLCLIQRNPREMTALIEPATYLGLAPFSLAC